MTITRRAPVTGAVPLAAAGAVARGDRHRVPPALCNDLGDVDRLLSILARPGD